MKREKLCQKEKAYNRWQEKNCHRVLQRIVKQNLNQDIWKRNRGQNKRNKTCSAKVTKRKFTKERVKEEEERRHGDLNRRKKLHRRKRGKLPPNQVAAPQLLATFANLLISLELEEWALGVKTVPRWWSHKGGFPQKTSIIWKHLLRSGVRKQFLIAGGRTIFGFVAKQGGKFRNCSCATERTSSAQCKVTQVKMGG